MKEAGKNVWLGWRRQVKVRHHSHARQIKQQRSAARTAATLTRKLPAERLETHLNNGFRGQSER
jgi:hypothetical protein